VNKYVYVYVDIYLYILIYHDIYIYHIYQYNISIFKSVLGIKVVVEVLHETR
jgi:hypothetical protein